MRWRPEKIGGMERCRVGRGAPSPKSMSCQRPQASKCRRLPAAAPLPHTAKKHQHPRGRKLDVTPEQGRRRSISSAVGVRLPGGRQGISGDYVAPACDSPIEASMRSKSWPSGPTSGRPTRSSSRPGTRLSPSAAPALPSAKTSAGGGVSERAASSAASDVRSSSVLTAASIGDGATCGTGCGVGVTVGCGEAQARRRLPSIQPALRAAAPAAGRQPVPGGVMAAPARPSSPPRRAPARREGFHNAHLMLPASWRTRRSRLCEFAAMQLSVEFLTVAMRQKGNYCGCYCYHISRKRDNNEKPDAGQVGNEVP